MPSNLTYRRIKSETPGLRSGWQIVFTSFILILLSFFILLSSFATMEPAKVMQFTRSFAQAVNVLTGGLHLQRGRTVMKPAPEMVDKKKARADMFDAVGAYAKALDLQKEVELTSNAKGVVMTLSDKALFRLGDARITDEALGVLNKIGAIISQTGYDVCIEGHTDNLPIATARFPSNWELSTARAVNVLRYFVERLKIPSHRLSAAGFGEFQPKVPNDTEANRAANRRVEIIFTRADEGRTTGRWGK